MPSRTLPAIVFLTAALAVPGAQSTTQGTSLLGKPLISPPVAEAARAKMEAQLAEARQAWNASPADADAIIWLGRRTAYLGRFREAIDIFTDGIAKHPADPRFYRHRGHRYLTVREIDKAIADFEKAVTLMAGRPDQVEPDGQPNARNVPTSSLHSNVWYHLGLGRYLKGDFARAAEAWRQARDAGKNPDNLVAASHWLYLSLRRAGQAAAADAVLKPISADLDVIENGSYHSLLLMYKRERSAGRRPARRGRRLRRLGRSLRRGRLAPDRRARRRGAENLRVDRRRPRLAVVRVPRGGGRAGANQQAGQGKRLLPSVTFVSFVVNRRVPMPFARDELVALVISICFAAGLNVYATIATLGLLARAGRARPAGVARPAHELVGDRHRRRDVRRRVLRGQDSALRPGLERPANRGPNPGRSAARLRGGAAAGAWRAIAVRAGRRLDCARGA